MSKEKEVSAAPGAIMLIVLFGFVAIFVWTIVQMVQMDPERGGPGIPQFHIFLLFGSVLAIVLTLPGFFVIQPNMSRVLVLFGRYKGSVKKDGFYWANPFLSKTSVSLRAQSLNGERLKVNDMVGNPVEIATIVVWQVEDTFKACFAVENYGQYVALQTETALRHSASSYPYDAEEENLSLMRNTDEVSAHLMKEIQEKLDRAGIKVLEARLSHLAYAPEIAGVMLRKQQAAAVIAARKRIVDGAVGMVEMALEHLNERKIVELDAERKAAMVSNLMVVLCSESSVQPVVNAGTIYG